MSRTILLRVRTGETDRDSVDASREAIRSEAELANEQYRAISRQVDRTARLLEDHRSGD